MTGNSVQSVERTFKIIETLSLYPHGITLKDLSDTVQLNKTTVYRLLDTLIQINYVSKDSQTGTYRLTIRMFQQGSRALDGMDILSVSRPYLEKLTAITNEVTHLVIPDDYRIVYLYKEMPHNNTMSSRIGTYNYMYCTGLGKSIMAAASDEEVIRIWRKSEIIQYTPNTITTLEQMQKEITLIRRQGYAIDNEEHETGIRCIAAAITEYSGKVIAAISVAASKIRLDDERIKKIAPHVASTATNISKVFGGIT